MVNAGLSKYEGASSNPAANTDVDVSHYIRRLTVECQMLERQKQTLDCGVM